MYGGLKMLITLRDNKNNLVAKDILDIDFDMTIEQDKGKYYILVNQNYRYDGTYETMEDAADQMRYIVNVRNKLEEELRDY